MWFEEGVDILDRSWNRAMQTQEKILGSFRVRLAAAPSHAVLQMYATFGERGYLRKMNLAFFSQKISSIEFWNSSALHPTNMKALGFSDESDRDQCVLKVWIIWNEFIAMWSIPSFWRSSEEELCERIRLVQSIDDEVSMTVSVICVASWGACWLSTQGAHVKRWTFVFGDSHNVRV